MGHALEWAGCWESERDHGRWQHWVMVERLCFEVRLWESNPNSATFYPCDLGKLLKF